MKPLFALIIIATAACRPEAAPPEASTDPAVYWQSVVIRAAARDESPCMRAYLDSDVRYPYWESVMPSGLSFDERNRVVDQLCRLHLR